MTDRAHPDRSFTLAPRALRLVCPAVSYEDRTLQRCRSASAPYHLVDRQLTAHAQPAARAGTTELDLPRDEPRIATRAGDHGRAASRPIGGSNVDWPVRFGMARRTRSRPRTRGRKRIAGKLGRARDGPAPTRESRRYRGFSATGYGCGDHVPQPGPGGGFGHSEQVHPDDSGQQPRRLAQGYPYNQQLTASPSRVTSDGRLPLGTAIDRFQVRVGQHGDRAGSITRPGLHALDPIASRDEVPCLDQYIVTIFFQYPGDPLCPGPIRLRVGDKEIPPMPHIPADHHI